MKKLSRLTAFLLAVIMLMTSVNAFAKTSKSPYIDKTYTHNSRFDACAILDGIDVSSHNGTIDWNAVKNAGTDFVILRAGVRGYGAGSYNSDKKFGEYIKGAHDKGLKIGVYFYSQAIST
ncbi:MAG: hypothetical protein IJT65_08470, partial [Eubacterium sp.]|nr:hypothetical protein [Eubacterium sp.]